MRAYSLQHRTSKRYLSISNGRAGTADYIAYSETPLEAEATTWRDRESAEQAHMTMGSFASCWRIIEVSRPPSPTEEHL